jgi:hypothetical protein
MFVLHNIILEYNGAYNWKVRVSHGVGGFDVDTADNFPVIDNYFSYISAHH